MNISESGGCGGPGQPPCPEDAIEFTVDYLKSPKYRERLEKSGYNDIDKLIKDRIDRIEKTKIVQFSGLPKTATEKLNSAITGFNYSSDPQSMYNPMIGSVLVNKFQADKTNSSINEVIAHELGHAEISARMDSPDVIVPAAVSMNYNDLSEMRKRSRIKRQNDLEPKSWEDRKNRHESNPEEVKSDLNALRYLLKEKGVYDAGKEDFTKEHLEKAPKSFTRDRLLRKYSEEDVIWLMNNIADNSETDNLFYGQEGGMIEPPENYYRTLAQIESGNNPNARAKTSSAAGLYQFTEGTWDSLVKDLGLNYTLDDRLDPEKSRKVVEEFTKRNEKSLRNKLGRNPNEAELYLAHFSGAGGARKLLDTIGTNPEALVTDFVSKAALKANKNVFFNEDGSPKKAYEIYNWSAKKFGSPVLKPVEPEQPEKTAPQNVRERKEVQKDNTRVRQPKRIPSLATTPTNPNYAALPDLKQEEEEATSKPVTEEQIRQLLSQERQAIESRFTEALRQQQVADQPEEDYVPQLQDVSHLYNYIDVNNYKYGGKKKKC